MIELRNVWKEYHLRGLRKLVLRDVNFQVAPGDALGICGANGAGKSTLMRLIGGVEQPTAGIVSRKMSTSWPIGFGSVFQTSMTGADNARFVARIYGKPVEPLLQFVEDFAELGPFYRQPVNVYSSGMEARLAFAISIAIDFDCYLIDEVIAAGDSRFQERCENALATRRDTSSLIMVSHGAELLRLYCDRGAVLHRGKLTLYNTIDEAIDVHRYHQRAA